MVKNTNEKANQKTTKKEIVMTTNKALVQEESHPLQHLIPSKEKWSDDGAYISREFGGVKDLLVLEKALETKNNVLISGPTGSAKTTFVYAFASIHQLPVVNVPCNGGADPRLFVGGWTPQADKSVDFIYGELVLAALHGGVVYLDEVNFLPPKISAYIHGMLDRRRTISIPEAKGSSVDSSVYLHPNCIVIGAYNPDYNGTRPLNQAFKNRFSVQLDFPYDVQIERELLNSPTLIELAVNLRSQYDLGHIQTPVSTNLMMEIEEWNESLGFDFALENFINHFHPDETSVVREVLVNYAPRIFDDLNEGDFNDSTWSFNVATPAPAEPAEATATF